jgi:ankyrin repeat protein
MKEAIEQLLRRYVGENTYSFQDFTELTVNSVGREGETPLHMACLRGAVDDVRLLIVAGADVNARTDIGATPAHRAVGGQNAEILRLLLEAGADPAASTMYGSTLDSMIEERKLPAFAEVLRSFRSQTA